MVFWKQTLTWSLGVLWLVSIGNAADSLRRVGVDPANGLATAVVVSNQELIHTSQLLPFDAAGKISKEDGAQIDALLGNLQQLLKNSAKKKVAAGENQFLCGRCKCDCPREEDTGALVWCGCLAGSQLRRIAVTRPGRSGQFGCCHRFDKFQWCDASVSNFTRLCRSSAAGE
jgi:hypothetical protein